MLQVVRGNYDLLPLKPRTQTVDSPLDHRSNTLDYGVPLCDDLVHGRRATLIRTTPSHAFGLRCFGWLVLHEQPRFVRRIRHFSLGDELANVLVITARRDPVALALVGVLVLA